MIMIFRNGRVVVIVVVVLLVMSLPGRRSLPSCAICFILLLPPIRPAHL